MQRTDPDAAQTFADTVRAAGLGAEMLRGVPGGGCAGASPQLPAAKQAPDTVLAFHLFCFCKSENPLQVWSAKTDRKCRSSVKAKGRACARG